MENKSIRRNSRFPSESEYHVLAYVTSEILWLPNLLDTLQVLCLKSTLFHFDNQATIHLATNTIFY